MTHATTRLLHAGAAPLRDRAGPINTPVVRASTLRFESMAVREDLQRRRAAGEDIASYGIHGLDTHRALEVALLALEGGERALLTPSGLAAVTLVLLALLSPGEHALLSDNVYSPVRNVDTRLLKRLGITLEYFSPGRDDVAALIRPETRLLYLESPGSLLNEVLDLPALTALAHARGVTVAVDNTWGAGYLHKPLDLGADISLQAGTKYIGGHSDLMLGTVVARDATLIRRLVQTHESLGLTIGADDAWLALRGLRTLPVRLAQHAQHALDVARFLQAQPEVAQIYYPALENDPGHALWQRDFSGANGLLSFELASADARAGHRLVDALQLFRIGASWGGYESLALVVAPERLAEHSRWTANGQRRGPLVRLHVGLEDPRDLVDDLAQALRASHLTHDQ